MAKARRRDHSRQTPPCDHFYKSENPPQTHDHYLPIGPFKMWLLHMMEEENVGFSDLAEMVQLNERTLRRILGTPDVKHGKAANPQKRISIDMVDWALTKADGATQLWHLYPELYETSDCDIEISA